MPDVFQRIMATRQISVLNLIYRIHTHLAGSIISDNSDALAKNTKYDGKQSPHLLTGSMIRLSHQLDQSQRKMYVFEFLQRQIYVVIHVGTFRQHIYIRFFCRYMQLLWHNSYF